MTHRDLPIGTVLGNDFVVQRPLADGGMGSVYVCAQRSTGNLRAVKVLSSEYVVDAAFRERFVLECQAPARIDSEHVARVVAAGIHEGLYPWIAMDLLAGETLAQRLARLGPLDVVAARVLFAELGHALVAAHASHIAHRDLKPENIFIARSARAGAALTVKVLDFGIAKAHDAVGRTTTSMTFGTPAWMAPEQRMPGAAGFQADVWSLGLLAFTVLTGRIYWRNADRSPADLAQEQYSSPYASASLRAREVLGRDVLPPSFDAWFARCVALRTENRFATVSEAVAGLDAVLVGAGVPPTQRDANATTAVPPAYFTPPPPLWTPSQPPRTQPGPANSTVTQSPWRWLVGLVAVGAAAAGIAAWLHPGSLATEANAPNATSASSPLRAIPEQAAPECPSDMAMISGGRVQGADGTVRDVPAFCLERREVRVVDYAACVSAGACIAITRTDPAGTLPNVCNSMLPDRGEHPINCVKHDEAERYCAWRGRRLPRSSEWARAAEGFPTRSWPWGDDVPGPSNLNACGLECPVREGTALSYLETDTWPTTAPVGSFPAGATPDGVMDLLGNVSERVIPDFATNDGRGAVRGSGFLDGPVTSMRALRRVDANYVGRTIGIGWSSSQTTAQFASFPRTTRRYDGRAALAGGGVGRADGGLLSG